MRPVDARRPLTVSAALAGAVAAAVVGFCVGGEMRVISLCWLRVPCL